MKTAYIISNRYKFFIGIFFLCLTGKLSAATISAQLDVNPVLLSDSFHLTYTADGSVDDEPDFSPIRKHFTLLGTQQSSNMSMINGNFKRSKKWVLSLRALKTGQFIIPAIKFGTDRAPEVEIEVKSVPVSNSSNPSSDFFVELEASPQKAFIQQQLIITARLLVARSISSYQFSELTINDDNATIKPLGKDKQYKTYRGSKPYIIVEKQFAVFPQKPGLLSIQPFTVEVAIPSNNSRNRFFDPFNTSSTSRRIQSKPLRIDIQDVSSNFTGKNWIATPSLKLIEQWPHGKKFLAGEPITRTLTLHVENSTAAQLPELPAINVTDLNQYPDKPILENKISSSGISAIRITKIAFIPTVAGSYTLPAISVPWWNTTTNSIDIARIPERTFVVSANPSSLAKQANQLPDTLDTGTTSNNVQPLSDITDDKDSHWMWFSLILLALWLITLYLLFKNRVSSKHNKKPETGIEKNTSLTVRLNALKHACSENNPGETKVALVNWARQLFNDENINNLSAIAEKLEDPVKSKILQLNYQLYSANCSDWTCGDIYQLCKSIKPQKNTRHQEKNVAKLEPF